MASPTEASGGSTLGRSIGRSANLGHSGMRRQGESAAPPISDEDRMRIAKATFRTSNHYEPEPEDNAGARVVLPSKEPRQLVGLMPNSIDPCRLAGRRGPLRGTEGQYKVAERGLGRAKKMGDCDYVRPDDRFDAQVSTTGRLSNGLPDSRGFIETMTEQQRRQLDAFSDDALDAFRKGREKELELQQQRQAILKQPFASAGGGDEWLTTSRAVHVPLLHAVDRTIADTAHNHPRPKPNKSVVEREKTLGIFQRPAATQHAQTFRDRDDKLRDVDALKSTDAGARAEQLAKLEHAKARSSPWVGGPPRSTYKDDMREFDVKECDGQMAGVARAPVVHAKHKTMEADAEDYIAQVQHRKATRNEGEYSTTVSDTLRDRLGETEPTTFRRAHFFERKGGCMQMPKRGDAPLRKDVNDHDPGNMTDINPQHFMSMKDMMERMAVGGLKP
eukprot:Hpha_TRINITY_DN16035_c4_g4::TRINITY_DN16035_c4_g4_i1::g.120395::m.120395